MHEGNKHSPEPIPRQEVVWRPQPGQDPSQLRPPVVPTEAPKATPAAARPSREPRPMQSDMRPRAASSEAAGSGASRPERPKETPKPVAPARPTRPESKPPVHKSEPAKAVIPERSSNAEKARPVAPSSPELKPVARPTEKPTEKSPEKVAEKHPLTGDARARTEKPLVTTSTSKEAATPPPAPLERAKPKEATRTGTSKAVEARSAGLPEQQKEPAKAPEAVREQRKPAEEPSNRGTELAPRKDDAERKLPDLPEQDIPSTKEISETEAREAMAENAANREGIQDVGAIPYEIMPTKQEFSHHYDGATGRLEARSPKGHVESVVTVDPDTGNMGVYVGEIVLYDESDLTPGAELLAWAAEVAQAYGAETMQAYTDDPAVAQMFTEAFGSSEDGDGVTYQEIELEDDGDAEVVVSEGAVPTGLVVAQGLTQDMNTQAAWGNPPEGGESGEDDEGDESDESDEGGQWGLLIKVDLTSPAADRNIHRYSSERLAPADQPAGSVERYIGRAVVPTQVDESAPETDLGRLGSAATRAGVLAVVAALKEQRMRISTILKGLSEPQQKIVRAYLNPRLRTDQLIAKRVGYASRSNVSSMGRAALEGLLTRFSDKLPEGIVKYDPPVQKPEKTGVGPELRALADKAEIAILSLQTRAGLDYQAVLRALNGKTNLPPDKLWRLMEAYNTEVRFIPDAVRRERGIGFLTHREMSKIIGANQAEAREKRTAREHPGYDDPYATVFRSILARHRGKRSDAQVAADTLIPPASLSRHKLGDALPLTAADAQGMAELLGASDEEVAALVEAYRQTKGDERQGT